MLQTKKESFIEATMNVAIGYIVALISQLIVFPLVGINIEFTTNLWIGFWFTIISIIRSYIIRRWFNAKLHKAALILSGNNNVDL